MGCRGLGPERPDDKGKPQGPQRRPKRVSKLSREAVVLLVSANLRTERRLKLLTSRARNRMEGNRPVESPSQIVSESKPPM